MSRRIIPVVLFMLCAAVLCAAVAGGAEQAVSREKMQQLFAFLSEKPLIAASGAGAWEGRLKFSADGSFSCYYYDEDAGEEVFHEVSFTGNFVPSGIEQRGDTCFVLQVENIITRDPPGTQAAGAWGESIVYDEPLFRDGDRLLLTLPGTAGETVPEMVQGEIGGTCDEWEDYSRFITLTRLSDGWGFFADPSQPAASDLEPAATAAPAPAAEPVPAPAEAPVPAAEPVPAPSEAPVPAAEPVSAPAEAPVPAAEPVPGPTETPAPAAEPAPAEDSGFHGPDGWTGCWQTRDDAMSELVITGNGDGTFSAEVFFLRTLNMHAALTPQSDGSMRFETDLGALTGVLSGGGEGILSLKLTGGYSFNDEEASEYNEYYARVFTYYPVAYEEMWYVMPSQDSPGSDGDWLGKWTVQKGDRQSDLLIERNGGGLRARITLNNGDSFSGSLDKSSGSRMDFSGDDFYCMLTLNRKLDVIVMEEIGSDSESVYDWLHPFPYSIVEYWRDRQETPAPEVPPDTSGAIPPDLTAPVTAGPGENTGNLPAGGSGPALLPIPDVPEYMQVPVSRVDATSYIVGKNDATAYAPFRMTDGEETTAFQFSTKTTPLGSEYLYFDFEGPARLDGIWMKNGFWKKTSGKNQYTRNCRIRSMTISVRFAGSDGYQFLQEITLGDKGAWTGWDRFRLAGAENVTGVRICIDEIYKGTRFKNDVCISEIMFVQATGQ